MKRVSGRGRRRSMRRRVAGSVVSSTVTGRPPGPGAQVRAKTRGARLLPPIPMDHVAEAGVADLRAEAEEVREGVLHLLRHVEPAEALENRGLLPGLGCPETGVAPPQAGGEPLPLERPEPRLDGC